MNTYYEVLKYLKSTFDADVRVNNVVTGDFEQWKRDEFSIVHINVLDSPFTNVLNTSTIEFNIEVQVLDIRDVNKEEDKDKFWFNDNRQDIWNETLSILNLARNKVIKDFNNDITLNAATSAERITYAYMNGLDGWSQTWTIEVPDLFTSVC